MFSDYFFNHNIYYTPSKHFWKAEKIVINTQNYHLRVFFSFAIKSFLPFVVRKFISCL
jgi:hypothetical protein